MSKPVAWLAYAPDASESSFVTQFQEQAEAAERDWGWSVVPLYASPQNHVVCDTKTHTTLGKGTVQNEGSVPTGAGG